ncbi:MAG: DoxX family protein [Acidimicrobiales bacterium]
MPVDADIDAINTALLILRVMLGVIMLAHGINHIIGGGKIEGTAGWFASLGMKPGIFHAWLASITEVAAGVLLVVGLLTPLAAAGVIGVMVVALITNHLKNGFFIFRPGEGYEYVVSLIAFGFVAALLGPGEWSLDNSFDLMGMAGWSGLVIGLVAGVGGALLLLAGFWRPEKQD